MKEIETQICTTIEQSKRLLDLGLKPETADCFHWEYAGRRYIGNIDDEGLTEKDVPAWSLHRLIEMCPETIFSKEHRSFYKLTLYKCSVRYVNDVDFVLHAPTSQVSIYDAMIEAIQWLIENNYLNTEYLKQ